MLRIFSFLLLLLSFSPAQAQNTPPSHSQVRLIAAVEGTGQLQSVQFGVEVTLDPGWKTYWRLPGEAGLAPVFDWAGSENLEKAQVSWPAPHRFVAQGMDNFGYQGKVVFPVEAVLEKPGKRLLARLKLDLLICEELCVPETHHLTIDLPAQEAKISKDQDIMSAALASLPLQDSESDFQVKSAALSQDGKKSFLTVTAEAAQKPGRDADLFVESKGQTFFAQPDIEYDAVTKVLRLRMESKGDESAPQLKKLLSDGMLRLTFVDGKKSYEREIAFDGKAVAETLPTQTAAEGLSLPDFSIRILLIAFLGGLVLNLMPCVLPVLSLKILSVLSHGGKDHRIHRWDVFRSFMASAAGIIFSFVVMAAVLSVLKAAGEGIGWGIQFQQPVFLVFLITVLLIFSANLAGFFEVPLPIFVARYVKAKHEHQPTLTGHFLAGAFAALLATPCTAPFLGTAIGFALARQAPEIFLIFTCLGLGLAFPYIVLALSPRLFKYMPRPGRWMARLKQVFAVFLLITALWLGHVLVYGGNAADGPDSGWQTFDESLIAPAVEEGKTVFVDVTADWCLTCKANKRLVLDRAQVADALAVPNVLRLQADWTQRNEAIAAYMRKYGRYGVPFDIVYGPNAPDGIILSEILTRDEVFRALSEAAGE